MITGQAPDRPAPRCQPRLFQRLSHSHPCWPGLYRWRFSSFCSCRRRQSPFRRTLSRWCKSHRSSYPHWATAKAGAVAHHRRCRRGSKLFASGRLNRRLLSTQASRSSLSPEPPSPSLLAEILLPLQLPLARLSLHSIPECPSTRSRPTETPFAITSSDSCMRRHACSRRHSSPCCSLPSVSSPSWPISSANEPAKSAYVSPWEQAKKTCSE